MMREIVIAACGVAIVALLAAISYQNYRRFHTPLLTTSFQAVTLVNGDVLYGRIDHLGTDHPVLRDAFSVSGGEPGRSSTARALVKRKDGPTGADHLIMPAGAILHVEPVRPDSEIGRLISEAGLLPR
jgi:hypothetical protein